MTTAHNDEPTEEESQAPEPPPSKEQRATSNDSASSEDAAGTEVAADLDALLADTKRERDEYLELAQRAKADFENYRKRTAREAAEAERRGKLALARELVPSIDNLERALAAAGEGSEVARGLELVHGELVATLKRAGVESFDPVGERFDPAHSEAVSMQPAPGVESGLVVETLDRGYRSDGAVLRPARVIVAE